MLPIERPFFSPNQRAILISLLAAALFFIRYGYGYGYSDQDELLPLVLHWLNPEMFVNDWFVALQTESFGIRTFMAGAIWLPSLVFNLKIVVFCYHLLVLLATGIAIHRIAEILFGSDTVSGLAVILVMVVTTRFNPGGNDIVHAMLVSSSVAWCFGLWAYERMLRGQYLTSGILCSLALLFHALVGLQIAAVYAVLIVLQGRKQPQSRSRFFMPILITAIPLVWIFFNLGKMNTVPYGSLDPVFIMTHLRVPHHYLPASFSSISWLKLSFLTVCSLLVLNVGRSLLTKNGQNILNRTQILLVAVLGFAYLLTYIWETPFVVRLQPFNLSVLLRVLATIVLASVIVRFVPRALLNLGDRLLLSRSHLALFVALICLTSIFYNIYAKTSKVDDFGERALFEWVSRETSQDAVFAIPPSMSGFQVATGRAQYVSFKSFPFSGEATLEWLRRLRLIAPVTDLAPGGVALQQRMDAAYAAQAPSYWNTFLQTERIDFIVRRRDIVSHRSSDNAVVTASDDDWHNTLEPSWCSDDWCVYWAGRILVPR